MKRSARELLFGVLISIAVGLAQASYLLGFGVGPVPTLVIGVTLVGVGVATVVPRRTRVPAAATGLLGILLAGAVIPRYAARAVRAGETLWLSLLLAGIVLLVTFAVLRITTFGPRTPQAT